MKDQVIAFLGAERAGKIEKRQPGTIESALYQVSTAPEKERVALAAIRALQSVGSAPSLDDLNKLREVRGQQSLEAPASRRAQRLAREAEAGKKKAVDQNPAAADAPTESGTPEVKTETRKSKNK